MLKAAVWPCLLACAIRPPVFGVAGASALPGIPICAASSSECTADVVGSHVAEETGDGPHFIALSQFRSAKVFGARATQDRAAGPAARGAPTPGPPHDPLRAVSRGWRGASAAGYDVTHAQDLGAQKAAASAASASAAQQVQRHLDSEAHGAGAQSSTASLAGVALVGGALLMLIGKKVSGLLLVYFGAQASFNMYMKIVLSNTEVSELLGLTGFPAGFLLTVIQQLITFVVCVVLLVVLWLSPLQYRPRVLSTRAEWVAMFIYSGAFALNHALNFFSLTFLSVSLNLVIRSCLPMVALVLQGLVACLMCGVAQPTGMEVSAREMGIMFLGVLFAVLATLAQAEGAAVEASEHLALGVVTEVLSVVCAAGCLVSATVLGSGMDFNPLDATLYCSLPSALMLLFPVFYLLHPTWPGQDDMTDWQVLLRIWDLNKSTIGFVALSGVFSAAYSIFVFALVRILSAGHAAFAGNVNRGLTILFAIIFGLEKLPSGVWCAVMLISVLGNVGAFAYYSALKSSDIGQKTPRFWDTPRSEPKLEKAKFLDTRREAASESVLSACKEDK